MHLIFVITYSGGMLLRFLFFKFKFLFWLFDSILSSVDKSFLPHDYYENLFDAYYITRSFASDIYGFYISKGASYEKKDAGPQGQKDFPKHSGQV